MEANAAAVEPFVRRAGRRYGCWHARVRQAGGHRWQIWCRHRAALRVNGHEPDSEATLFKKHKERAGLARPLRRIWTCHFRSVC
jgi:hypothetical protein